MSKWIVAGLIVLNVVLGAGLCFRAGLGLGLERRAEAQGIGGTRGDFAVVAGSSNNATVVYLMEVSTGQLAALRIDPVNRQIQVAAKADVARALQAVR